MKEKSARSWDPTKTMEAPINMSSKPVTQNSMIDLDYDRRNKAPRPLSENERARLEEFIDSIHYSPRYSDNEFEYRHVQLPKNMLKQIPKEYHDSQKGTLKLLWEEEWRALGITQSLGWEHYEVHEPEPHILLFKRPINYVTPDQQLSNDVVSRTDCSQDCGWSNKGL